jgi:hypothetical protein
MENEVEKLSEILRQEEQPRKFPFLPLVLVIGLGIMSGFVLTKIGGGEGPTKGGVIAPKNIKPGSEFGSKNQTFKDTTIGVLEKGGIDGEGTHKLIREGGPSQTAYLTSSVLDLDQFVGKKVQVWGETFQGQKAGWLMDVGRIKILE